MGHYLMTSSKLAVYITDLENFVYFIELYTRDPSRAYSYDVSDLKKQNMLREIHEDICENHSGREITSKENSSPRLLLASDGKRT